MKSMMPPPSARKKPTFKILRDQAEQQRLPTYFLTCQSPLPFVNRSQRKKVAHYIKGLSDEFQLNRDTAARAVQYFDCYSIHANKVQGDEWVRAENDLRRFKKAAGLVLSKRIGEDCANHVLSFLQRNALTPEKKKLHFEKARDLAETVSVVSLVLASKFSERQHISYRDALDILSHKMSLKEIAEHEQRVLQVLQWRLNTFTGYNFAELLCKHVGLDYSSVLEAKVQTNLHAVATLYELQWLNPCEIAALAILTALSKHLPDSQDPEDSQDEDYYKHLESISRACGLNHEKKTVLDSMTVLVTQFKRGRGAWSF